MSEFFQDQVLLELCEISQVKLDQVTLLTSPQAHYRCRCVLSIDHTISPPKWTLYDESAQKIVHVDEHHPSCQLYMQSILDAMPIVLSNITANVASVLFLYAMGSGELLICLNSASPIIPDEPWISSLQSSLPNANLIMRTRGSCHVIGRPFVTDKITLQNGKTITLRHVDNQFSNPNPYIATKCLNWLIDQVTRYQPKMITEMYSGDSHHTCAIAPLVESVTCVEIQERLVQAARLNVESNGLINVEIVNCDCSKFSRGVKGDIEFALVDPPRAGLDQVTLKMLGQRALVIVYISCNPEALVVNMRSLTSTHRVDSICVMDHFPRTGHFEVGIVLVRL